MKGIDVSHWQGKIDWSKVKKDGVEFAIIKCTESLNYIDPTFEKNKKDARTFGILLGFYHFAKGNDAIKEADHFLSKIGEMKEGEFLVLDWEINHFAPVKWCKMFLDRVQEKTGIRPLLYTNEARVKSLDWSKVVKGDYGLWVAKYGQNNGKMNQQPSIGAWPFLAIWQYTSRGRINGIFGNVDLNWSHMSIETLRKYGKQSHEITEMAEENKIVILEEEKPKDKKKIAVEEVTKKTEENKIVISADEIIEEKPEKIIIPEVENQTIPADKIKLPKNLETWFNIALFVIILINELSEVIPISTQLLSCCAILGNILLKMKNNNNS